MAKHPPQQVFVVGERVEDLTDDYKGRGTVAKISPSGYVYVALDSGYRLAYTPATAHKRLRKCQPGPDSLSRHDWDCSIPGKAHCAYCGAAQTDANEFDPCDAAVARPHP